MATTMLKIPCRVIQTACSPTTLLVKLTRCLSVRVHYRRLRSERSWYVLGGDQSTSSASSNPRSTPVNEASTTVSLEIFVC